MLENIQSPQLTSLTRTFQAARKKLESRRLAYDTSISKAQRSKREDFRLEEEVRSSKAKFEEANEDVLRRMQDIKEAETDSLRELGTFLDAQLDFHERCTEELRRAREELASASRRGSSGGRVTVSPPRSRPSLLNYSYSSYTSENSVGREQQHVYEEEYEEPEQHPAQRMGSVRVSTRRPPPEVPSRAQTFGRSNSIVGRSPPTPSPSFEHRVSTHQMIPIPTGNMRAQLRPVSRINTDVTTSSSSSSYSRGHNNVFADGYDDETPDSASLSPEWGPSDRCASPATSHSSWSRSTTGSSFGQRKAPPPPPPCRSKKPPPPIPPKREFY